MNEQLVSFKTAMLLKGKGFDWNCYAVYDPRTPSEFLYEASLYSRHCDFYDINIFNNSTNTVLDLIAAPTQSLAQKWLREVHHINIAILPKMLPSNEIKYYIFEGKIKTNWIDLHDTYEEALEKAIQESFKYVK